MVRIKEDQPGWSFSKIISIVIVTGVLLGAGVFFFKKGDFRGPIARDLMSATDISLKKEVAPPPLSPADKVKAWEKAAASLYTAPVLRQLTRAERAKIDPKAPKPEDLPVLLRAYVRSHR